MKLRWPWRRDVTDEQIAESVARLKSVRAQQGDVDQIEAQALAIIRRNHLGESIHRALGG